MRSALPRGEAVGKHNKRISKKEFVNRFTELTMKHLSKLPPEEQDARLEAFERRVATICRDKHPTPSRTPETPATRLVARAREDR